MKGFKMLVKIFIKRNIKEGKEKEVFALIKKLRFEAMNQAIAALNKAADLILIDGNKTPQQSDRMVAIIKGDQRVDCISAASILAKVARDREMFELDERFPEYGFSRHKGYPTKAHFMALEIHGPIDEHRQSFAPVSRLVHSG